MTICNSCGATPILCSLFWYAVFFMTCGRDSTSFKRPCDLKRNGTNQKFSPVKGHAKFSYFVRGHLSHLKVVIGLSLHIFFLKSRMNFYLPGNCLCWSNDFYVLHLPYSKAGHIIDILLQRFSIEECDCLADYLCFLWAGWADKSEDCTLGLTRTSGGCDQGER